MWDNIRPYSLLEGLISLHLGLEWKLGLWSLSSGVGGVGCKAVNAILYIKAYGHLMVIAFASVFMPKIVAVYTLVQIQVERTQLSCFLFSGDTVISEIKYPASSRLSSTGRHDIHLAPPNTSSTSAKKPCITQQPAISISKKYNLS